MPKQKVIDSLPMDTTTDIITINKKDISALVVEGSNLAFSKTSEDAIIKFLDFLDWAEKQKELLKTLIYEEGKKQLPSITGIKGKALKFYIKKTPKYLRDSTKPLEVEVSDEITFRKLNVAKVAEYVEKAGKMPSGVKENDKQFDFILSRKKDEK